MELHTFAILYLDDEQDNLISFKAVFRRHFNVFTAINAAEAFNVLDTNKIDLTISDQRMPELSGVEYLEQVKEKFPGIIRMLLTGYSEIQAVIDAINKGQIYYYATKPWKFETLKVIFDNALDAYSLKEKNELLIHQNQLLQIKNLALDKAQMVAKYDILKNQINPHFLFNCLNTLSSIISADPAEAIIFTSKFANLYRTILEFGEQSLIPLAKEIKFMGEYLYLQNTRFGANIQLWNKIKNYDFVIPPFAVQTLIENVIKHNMISADYPMIINIEQNEDTLIVKNIICKKQNSEPSTKIGLENLSQRYLLLTGKDLIVANDGISHIVHLPIIPIIQ